MNWKNSGAGIPARWMYRGSLALVLGLACLTAGGSPAHAWTNLLQDPGFETYEKDADSGRYYLPESSPWYEYGFAEGSVQFDASDWKAPEAMLREMDLGFTPGTGAWQGHEPGQSKGILTLRQDVVKPEGFAPGNYYESWVWFGGAGNDEGDCPGGPDEDERASWSVAFYGSANPAEWDDMDPIEFHDANYDYPGEPESFFRISRFGTIPQGAQGFRFEASAQTWYPPAGPKGDVDAQVALDNAHFAIIETPNLLENGNFNQDQRVAELRGWQRPAAYEFPKNGQQIQPIINVYGVKPNWGHNFDNGPFLPYRGGTAYGYETYITGWMDDAFNFSQVVDYPYPDGTPLLFTHYWMQNVNNPNMGHQLSEHGSELEYVFRYMKDGEILETEKLMSQWPVITNKDNTCRYDANVWMAHNPRFRLTPPEGTQEIEVNINCMIHLEYQDGLALVSYAVDDFWLSAAEAPGE